MSISVILIGGAALCFVLWKVWGIAKGKSGCGGCGGSDGSDGSCGGCKQECPSKKK